MNIHLSQKRKLINKKSSSYSQLRHACTQQACPSLSWILAHFLCHMIFQHHQASSFHQQIFTLPDQQSLLAFEKFGGIMVSFFVFAGDELHNRFWASNHRKIEPNMTQRGHITFEFHSNYCNMKWYVLKFSFLDPKQVVHCDRLWKKKWESVIHLKKITGGSLAWCD